jgi:hypothetical protein
MEPSGGGSKLDGEISDRDGSRCSTRGRGRLPLPFEQTRRRGTSRNSARGWAGSSPRSSRGPCAGTRLIYRLTPFLAASLTQLGRLDEARAGVELFLVGNPHFTTRHWATTEPFRDAVTLEHVVDGYRKAGLPERRAAVMKALSSSIWFDLLLKATRGVTIALVSSRERKRRQPGLATDDPAFVGWHQLVRGIQGS